MRSKSYTSCCLFSSWGFVTARSNTPLLLVPPEATEWSSFGRDRELERPRLFFPETLPGCSGTGRSVRVRLASRLLPSPFLPAPSDLLRRLGLLRDRDDPRLLDLERRLDVSGSILSSSSDAAPFFLRFFLLLRVRSRKKNPR